MITAGLGCRGGASADAIVALVQQAEQRAKCRVDALAAPAFKRGERGLHDAADRLGLRVSWVEHAALAAVQGNCPTRSPAALRQTGLASVAEAAALAASGGTLLLPRIAAGGATCALAQSR